MNDDKNTEPVTNLSLAQGHSNQCIQRILNNEDPGAGANAASRVDMTFVATDPLSELVWSPQKGLSLRCADGSFSNKKPSLLWGVGSTKMGSGSSSDMPTSNNNKPINEKDFMGSLAARNIGSEVAGGDNYIISPTSNAGIMPLSGSSHELRTDKTGLEVVQNNQKEPIGSATNVGDRNHALGMEIVLASEIHSVKQCEAYDTKMQNKGKGLEESTSVIGKESKNTIVIEAPGTFPLERLESTAENDLESPLGENVYDRTTRIVPLESADRGEINTRQNNELLPIDLAVKQSPTNRRIQRDKKGKCKALSDGDANEIMLNEEDGSHESVESCNSAGLFSTGKRPWNFEQQLIVGSKRVKRQIQESPSSSLIIKQDSSFMNWISNMMKGFSKSSKGEVPSLSPALANCSNRHDNPDQNLITCNRNEDTGSKTIGFQSIFQSLYCRNTKVQEVASSNIDHPTEGLKEQELDNKICDLNATPIACRLKTGNVYKRFLPSNDRFNESASGSQASPVIHCKDLAMNFAVIQENNRSNLLVNKSSCNLATDKGKDGTSSNSSRDKHKKYSFEKIDCGPPFEGKTACNFGPKGDPLESLWIARFTPKTSGPLLNQDPSNKSTGEALDCSSDDQRQKPQVQNPLCSFDEHENEEPLHEGNSGTAAESLFGPYRIKEFHDEKSMYKQNPTKPSPSLKNSEAMASVFARRLDALKHLTPSNEPDHAAHATVICLFCGVKGHQLQECSEITDTELEDILRNMNSYNDVKELPCVCIRCFQLNHWAVECPIACSRVRNQTECDASLVNQCRPSKMQLDARNEDHTKIKEIAAGSLALCDRHDSRMEKDLNLAWKLNEAANSGEMKLNAKLVGKEIASSSREKKLKENLVAPLYESSNSQISDVPNGIFDAIRKLRLSRTDILKWMNSHMPLSHLDGFFLRLRLGKWEEGLGGTGYYVACITGAQMDNSPQKSKKSIGVDVGGIKCLVESQYVSNHGFLEDELVAWWSATSRSGHKLPSKEELRLKVEEKKMLGF
ncbi:uncharacterized protein LOC110611301 isoform X2 [Manihot esculenta]|uniref:Uncharacterized protein n=5 Tax=Manihot esculenta TaxID=3983 RepID=A0ACB7I6D3_MANES|nr:uncharacterized protein LOC110611301 isoform X2 [Manihot esculenta]KAG8658631.1 hypothetical protein MANES_03G168800v8 [Manihot esculenta]KAG8658632.1 hypothetical protein MANES_03G168800v8 [Manihot esculenta]KAG8658633.1 hypothetical protein MANES_03G168800v8 [Manihot esculenta]